MPSQYTDHLAIGEDAIMNHVAEEYKLNPAQHKLLKAIRKQENGGPGREFGVLHPDAMRYKDDPYKSYVTQAHWAAGTIKKRYTGDVDKFAKRWAPVGAKNDPKGLNKNWAKNVKKFMAEEGDTDGND